MNNSFTCQIKTEKRNEFYGPDIKFWLITRVFITERGLGTRTPFPEIAKLSHYILYIPKIPSLEIWKKNQKWKPKQVTAAQKENDRTCRCRRSCLSSTSQLLVLIAHITIVCARARRRRFSLCHALAVVHTLQQLITDRICAAPLRYASSSSHIYLLTKLLLK